MNKLQEESENELIEIEDEEDDFFSENSKNEIISFRIEDKSVEEIMRLLLKGRIIINSEYQRAFVWNEVKQTRLIDSIFLGMPIPPIWLVRRLDRKMEVIDGLQRITSIKNFKDDKLTLKSMTLSNLDSKKFSDLSNEKQFDFLDSNLKLAIINEDAYKNKNIIYELFKRINQNTEPLKKQELRNATYISEFNSQLKKFADSNEIVKKIIPPKEKIRMKNIEMFYRFLSTFQKYNKEKGIVENLKSVDERVSLFMDDARKFSKNQVNFYLENLKKAIEKVFLVFELDSFRKWDGETKKFKKALNVPLMEMQLIVLSVYDTNFLSKNKNKIIQSYKEMLENDDVLFSLRAATDSQENTNFRIKDFKNKLDSME